MERLKKLIAFFAVLLLACCAEANHWKEILDAFEAFPDQIYYSDLRKGSWVGTDAFAFAGPTDISGEYQKFYLLNSRGAVELPLTKKESAYYVVENMGNEDLPLVVSYDSTSKSYRATASKKLKKQPFPP